MRVLVLALCIAAGAVLVPAGAFAASPGDVHQSNRNTQVVVVNNQGAQSAGLISGPIVIPVNGQVGLNLNDVLNGIHIL
jgi:hypothetical protein